MDWRKDTYKTEAPPSLEVLVCETFTLRSSYMHDAIRAAYFSLVELTEPKLKLQPKDASHLADLMRLAIHCQSVSHPRRDECLRLLYNLFLIDLTASQESSIRQHRFPKRVEEIYLDFLRLLSQHFVEHRDIAFYADHLCITTTYLSRIVRQVSGRTVADTTTFARFFKRLRGCTPKEYRQRQQ